MIKLWMIILLDFSLKDPTFLYHPVRFFGLLIKKGEMLIRKYIPDKYNRLMGVVLVLGVLGLVLSLYGLLRGALGSVSPYLSVVLDVYLAYTLLASGSLMEEGRRIYVILKEGDLAEARKSLSYLVSRDTAEMTLPHILRGAIETLSENITDGIVSPLFYLFFFGVPGMLVFKVISTFDSMIGYKNEHYLQLGWFAARFDDVLNFVPARLSGVLVVVSAFFVKEDYKAAYRIFKRDRLKHASPNSACTESAVAGALSIQLGGSASYFGKIVEKPTIGDGKPAENCEVLFRVNRLILVTTLLMGVLLTVFYGIRGDYFGF